MSGKRYSWTQPVCASCFGERYPDKAPTQLLPHVREEEVCVDCGTKNTDGIYIRVDPHEAKHPTYTRDD